MVSTPVCAEKERNGPASADQGLSTASQDRRRMHGMSWICYLEFEDGVVPPYVRGVAYKTNSWPGISSYLVTFTVSLWRFQSVISATVESSTCAVLREPRCSFSRSVGWRNAVGGVRGVGCARRGHDEEAGGLIAEGAVLALDLKQGNLIAVTTAITTQWHCYCLLCMTPQHSGIV